MAVQAEVRVVGLGARTPLGKTAAASAAAVRAGIAGLHEHPFMIDTAGNKMIVARASYLNGETGEERLLALAEPAVREALAPLDVRQVGPRPIPVTVGMPPARPGQPTMEMFASRLQRALSDTGRSGPVHAITTGHAAGLQALEAGYRAIQTGKDELHLIGGVDSYLEPETLEWLEACDQLHGAGPANNAWGFIPGEGAGFCLLASEKWQARHGVKSLGGVLSSAVTREENRIKTETVCIGRGLTDAFRQALAALPDGAKVDQVICDQNGETYRADEYGFAVVRHRERLVSGSQFIAPADCWGDVGAASGPLYLLLAGTAAERGYAKGEHYLVWCSSESGERGAALLGLDVQPREG